MNTYDSPAARIGKFKGELLAHAQPVEVLATCADQKRMPKNSSDTVIYRRWLPYGGSTDAPLATNINQWNVDATAHELNEGVTPDADDLTPQDITVVMRQYGCLYMYTDKVADLYEDNVPEEQKVQTGERMGLVREMIRWGTLKGCTNKFYAGGTSRVTVDEALGLAILRRVTRSLRGNRGKMVTKTLAPSVKFNTSSVEPGWVVFSHTDVESDIRDLPGFKPCSDYGSMKRVHDMEIGATEHYRFVVSPELDPIADSGGAVGTTGLYSTTGTQIDVYPVIVCAADSYADVALRGAESVDPTHIPAKKKDKQDPLGQRGYVGAKFYSAAFVQNDGWMAVIEVGVSALQ